MIAWRRTCTRSVASIATAFTLSRTASAAPWPAASQPTASMQLSGPRLPVRDISSSYTSTVEKLMVSAPPVEGAATARSKKPADVVKVLSLRGMGPERVSCTHHRRYQPSIGSDDLTSRGDDDGRSASP
jgi:hypothetical protein